MSSNVITNISFSLQKSKNHFNQLISKVNAHFFLYAFLLFLTFVSILTIKNIFSILQLCYLDYSLSIILWNKQKDKGTSIILIKVSCVCKTRSLSFFINAVHTFKQPMVKIDVRDKTAQNSDSSKLQIVISIL